MAAGGLSVRELARRAGLDERTVRKILAGNRPHAQTLHRLAAGLAVSVDEFYLDDTQLRYRCFDRQTNPMVDEMLGERPNLFAGWTADQFDELHSHMGTGGALTRDGVLLIAERMNRKRQLRQKLDLLLETTHAELIGRIIDAMHEEATDG
jgi:transcriptional regulator with XRE-family HTH domain